MAESTKKNAARNQKSRLRKIKKHVSDSWEKSQNPNLFGGGPVLDPSGRIVSMNVSAYGYVAEVFEDQYVHDKLMEAFRKNNIHFKGFTEEELVGKPIKKKVVTWPPQPPLPIFIMKSYPLQSYLSQLIR